MAKRIAYIKSTDNNDDNKTTAPNIHITEQGVRLENPHCFFEYDRPKTAKEHFHDFCDVVGARILSDDVNKFALVTGVASGLVVLKIGKGRGSFIPRLNPGKFGIQHTTLGNLFIKTKRIIDINTGTAHPIFGVIKEQWPEGINRSTLVQPDAGSSTSAIDLLADGAFIPIEPTQGYRFLTPFYREPGAGSGFVPGGITGENIRPRPECNVYAPYLIGIMSLGRSSLSELIRAFNPNWLNGPLFARKNPLNGNCTSTAGGYGGLEK